MANGWPSAGSLPETLAAGTILGTFEWVVSAAETKEYCDGVRETLALYESDGIVHPGAILQMANRSLAGNVLISPWIHVSSTVQNFAVARIDSKLAARGRVLKEYEHKGHKFVRNLWRVRLRRIGLRIPEHPASASALGL